MHYDYYLCKVCKPKTIVTYQGTNMYRLCRSKINKYLWLIFSLPNIAIAEDLVKDKSLLLPTLQVSEKVEDKSPPNMSTITRKTLDQRFIKNFGDLAKRAEPGVNFNRSNQSINIRGLEQDRILTTVDGIRIPYLNDKIRGEKGGIDSIDFYSLSKLDIIRGSDSAQPSAVGMGGTVNLYTLDPEDLLTKGKNFGSLFKTDYDSSDQSYGANLALAGRLADTSILVQAGKRQGHELDNKGHSNLYGNQRTTPEPNNTKQENFLIKVKQNLGSGHQIGLTGEQFSKTEDIDLRTNQGTIFAINNNDSRELVKRQRVSADYKYRATNDDTWLDEANAILYWQHAERGNKQEAYRNNRPYGNYMRHNQLQKEMYGTSGNISKFISLGAIEQKITLGGEWYQLNAKQTSSGYDNCPTFTNHLAPSNPNFPLYMACSSLHTNQSDMPKTHGQQWAIYLANDISFIDNKIILTPAIRYDHYKHTPQNTNDYAAGKTLGQNANTTSKDSKVSGSFSIKWQIADQATIYARWSQGFKAPDPTELYMNYINTGVGYATLGNSKLKPEESNNFELGTNLGNDALGGSINLFYSKYKNFIDNIAVDKTTMNNLGLDPNIYRYGVERWENRSKVRIYGAEATAHWQFADHWKIWSSAAWAVGKGQKSHQYLNSVAPLTGIVGLSYQKSNWGGDVILTTAAKRNKTEYDTDFKTPGYGVIDLTAYWQPSIAKGLRLQAGVFNVMNKKYWNALNLPDTGGNSAAAQPYDYYTESGRSFRVAATYQF